MNLIGFFILMMVFSYAPQIGEGLGAILYHCFYKD